MVNTFIIGTIEETVRALDGARLNKQRIETVQIISSIERGEPRNHPAIYMWRGHVAALQQYHNAVERECIRRKYKPTHTIYTHVDHLEAVYADLSEPLPPCPDFDKPENLYGPVAIALYPWWFQWRPLHLSHQASLLRKAPEHYGHIFTSDEVQPYLNTGYIWPSKLTIAHPNDFTIDMCSDIGAGAPAQYRWSREEVERWVALPTRNPKTGRQLKPTKTGAYSDLCKAQTFYNL